MKQKLFSKLKPNNKFYFSKDLITITSCTFIRFEGNEIYFKLYKTKKERSITVLNFNNSIIKCKEGYISTNRKEIIDFNKY